LLPSLLVEGPKVDRVGDLAVTIPVPFAAGRAESPSNTEWIGSLSLRHFPKRVVVYSVFEFEEPFTWTETRISASVVLEEVWRSLL